MERKYYVRNLPNPKSKGVFVMCSKHYIKDCGIPNTELRECTPEEVAAYYTNDDSPRLTGKAIINGWITDGFVVKKDINYKK